MPSAACNPVVLWYVEKANEQHRKKKPEMRKLEIRGEKKEYKRECVQSETLRFHCILRLFSCTSLKTIIFFLKLVRGGFPLPAKHWIKEELQTNLAQVPYFK